VEVVDNMTQIHSCSTRMRLLEITVKQRVVRLAVQGVTVETDATTAVRPVVVD
jgi:hypothetical protein